MQLFRKIAICFILFFCLNKAFSFPITPYPLRKLVEESENIVVARVLNVTHNPKDWHDATAILLIKEVWQGNISVDTIKVCYDPGLYCPAAAVYLPQRTVLAFLDKNKSLKDKKQGGYTTHALSYGTKYPGKQGLIIFKQRIQEMQQIQKIKSSGEKRRQTISWLVNCCKHSVTRWDGVYELLHGDFMFEDNQGKNKTPQKLTVSQAQLAELRKAMFTIETIHRGDMDLIFLMFGKGDQEIADFLIKKIKYLKMDDQWFADIGRAKIISLAKRKDLWWIIKKVKQLNPLAKDYQEQQQSLAKAFMLLH